MSSDLEGRCFVKKGNALRPADFAADEFMAAIPDGKEVTVIVRRPRSAIHHRWFFALLRKVCENTGLWASEEELLSALKLATGHCDRQMTLDGSVYLVPKSIAFSSLSEDEFNIFKERCLHLLATKVLGCDPATLLEEVDKTQRAA